MREASDNSGGEFSFARQYRLWSAEQEKAARELLKRIDKEQLETIRFAFADQHGILRGKALMAAAVPSAFSSGVTMTTTLLAKDTSHKTVFPAFNKGAGIGVEQMTGAADFVLLPDPATFRILPWAHKTGWILCDIYFRDGTPIPFSTRAIAQSSVAKLAEAGFEFVSGLEIECHLFKLEDAHLTPADSTQPATPPSVSLLGHGFQYLTEQRFDALEPVLEIIRRDLLALGLPLNSIEVEFGPSQVEFTFDKGSGVGPADDMMLFRSAVKQIARRNGLHASFMCRPGLDNLFSSGWHLHQSLIDLKSGRNAFLPDKSEAPLSAIGKYYVAGLLDHALAACVFTTPTINGYKRYKPYSLAPDRASWARDNRGAMIRVMGGANDPATRIENRIGDPAANPYLYQASQIISGLDGIARKLDPGPLQELPYESSAALLPQSLMEAVAALKQNKVFADQFTQGFIDYITGIKQAEIDRFLAVVTDWEHKEYFDIF